MDEKEVRRKPWSIILLASLVVTGLFTGHAQREAAAQEIHPYQIIDVTDGATIKGVATWKGDIPKLPPIKVFKHMDVCGQTVPSPVLQIDPASKGVRFVLVYLENIQKGKAPEKIHILHMGKTPTRPESALCNFEEHIFPFARTGIFGLQNFENLLHNPHGFDEHGATLFNVAMPNPLQLTQKKFPRAHGVGLRYQCDTHVHMNGWMSGFEHPYFAVTDEKGHFEITNVPPGLYKVAAWHEGYNIQGFMDDHRPIYDEPHIIEQPLEIKSGETAEMHFEFPVRDVKVEWKIAGENGKN